MPRGDRLVHVEDGVFRAYPARRPHLRGREYDGATPATLHPTFVFYRIKFKMFCCGDRTGQTAERERPARSNPPTEQVC